MLKEIASIRAFLENDNIDHIIRLCKLTPKESWYIWRDEANNQLVISMSTKKIITIQSKKEPLTTRDLYRKSTPEQIISISSWGLIAEGKCGMVGLWVGKDDRLRGTYVYNKKWQSNPYPILCGYNLLNIVASNYQKRIKQEYSEINIPKRFGFQPIKIYSVVKENNV